VSYVSHAGRMLSIEKVVVWKGGRVEECKRERGATENTRNL
jgi:hypothetical protein